MSSDATEHDDGRGRRSQGEASAAAEASSHGVHDLAYDEFDPSPSPAGPPTAVPVGQVYLPADGTPVGKFNVVVDADDGTRVEIGSFVTADTDEGSVVGVVSEMEVYGDHTRPQQADLDGPAAIGKLPPVRTGEVQVMRSKRMRPVGAGLVRPASEAEVAAALGMDAMAWPIPVGTARMLSGDVVPVSVDGEFVAGPEGQGLLVFGRSGVASKTSFMTVALKSLLASTDRPDPRTGYRRSAAALVVNVKGEDLVWLDHPPEPSQALQDTDHEMYEALGADPEPFADVTVYAPADVVSGARPATVRPDATPLSWDLQQVWKYLPLLEPEMYSDDKMMSFVSIFESEYMNHSDPGRRIESFRALEGWLRKEIEDAEDAKNDTILEGRIHRATAARVLRKFSGLRARSRGLISEEKAVEGHDVPVTDWRQGEVKVLDLARLNPEVQGFVIARTVDRLLSQAEGDGLGVDHLVVVTDELNQWAPSGSAGEFDAVRRTLRRLASQGRYSRICLFGAAQSASKINEHVRDNSVTKAVGSSADSEVTSGVHGRIGPGLAEKIASLPKGSTMLWHPSFRQPVAVMFPRPAWRMGRADPDVGTARPRPPTFAEQMQAEMGDAKYDALGMSEDLMEELAARHGSVKDAAKAVLASSQSQPTQARARYRPRSMLDDWAAPSDEEGLR